MSEKYKIYVDDYATPIADHNAMEVAKLFKQNKMVRICNHVVFDAIRVLIMRGEIPWEDVEVYHKDRIYFINKYGRCSDWPRDFFNENDDFLEELVGWGVKIKMEA